MAKINANHMNTKNKFNRIRITAILFRLGLFFVVGPLLLYLAIILKGDIILKWPFPFSHLGGAPFQLLADGILISIGLIFIVASLVLKKSK